MRALTRGKNKMMRINDMKYFLSFLLVLFALPALAQSTESLSDLKIDYDQYYRYANKKCDFSFQLPEPPTAKIIWGEMKVPLKVKDMPNYGEIGEHVIYHVKSLDQKNYFILDAYCLYSPIADYKSVDLAALEAKFEEIASEHNLRNYNIKTEAITDEFFVGTLNGMKVLENEKVENFYYQYFKGKKSVLMLEMRHNAEQIGMERMHKYLQDSLIYGGN